MKATYDPLDGRWHIEGGNPRGYAYEPLWDEILQSWCMSSEQSFWDAQGRFFRDRASGLRLHQGDCPQKLAVHGPHTYEHPEYDIVACPGVSEMEANLLSLGPGDEYSIIVTDHGLIGDIEVVRAQEES